MGCENELLNYLTNYSYNEIYDLHRDTMKQIFWNTRIEFVGNKTSKWEYMAHIFIY